MGIEDFYNPLDFSRIVGYPHDLPEIVIENFPYFHDNNDANAIISVEIM